MTFLSAFNEFSSAFFIHLPFEIELLLFKGDSKVCPTSIDYSYLSI